MNNNNKSNFFTWFFRECRRIIYIMLDEYRLVFRDSGLLVVFIGASILYPLLYSSIYKNETVREMPVGVVNDSPSQRSRNLTKQLDATPDLKVVGNFDNLEDVKDAFNRRLIHGAIYIPEDFNSNINSNRQATVSIYCDMSSFLYYRTMMMGANYTILEFSKNIKTERLNIQGISGREAEISAAPFGHEDNILYNHSMGFASFLLPALLILMVHQTLFFGITMINGTAREENKLHQEFYARHRAKFMQTLFGKSLCYFSLYLVISAYILLVTPKIFQLPHLGDPMDIMKFMIPFIFAVIFFSTTISTFIRNRETGMVIFLFFSLILLFLSGFSWPQSNMHWFWRTFALLFPSTFGIQGYIKMNTMGADLSLVKFEALGLWIQAILYFITTVILQTIQGKRQLKENDEFAVVSN